MHWKTSAILFFVQTAFFLYAGLATGDNLIKNGDFSRGLEGWNRYQWVTATRPEIKDVSFPGVTSTVDKEERQDSSASHRFTLSDESPLEWVGYATQVTVKPNTAYHFSCWIQGRDIHGGRGVGVSITELDSTGELANHFAMGASFFGTFPWKKIEGAFTTSGKTMKLLIGESIMTHGSVWYAGFNLAADGPAAVVPTVTKTSGEKKTVSERSFNLAPDGKPDITLNYDFTTAQEKISFTNQGDWDLSDCIGLKFDYRGDGSNRVFEVSLKDAKGATKNIGFAKLRSTDKKDAVWRIELPGMYDSRIQEITLTINDAEGEKRQGRLELNNIRFLHRGMLRGFLDKKGNDEIIARMSGLSAGRPSTTVTPNLSQVWNEPVIPEKYPTFKNEKVKPATRAEVGYQLHGMTQANTPEHDFYYKVYNFGDTWKPYYYYIDNPNWKEDMRNAFNRGLNVVGIWGYVPKGDPAGSYFTVSDEKHKWLMDTAASTGKLFLGYEDGEQDNRFLWNSGGSTRQEAYQNFKKFSETNQRDLQNYTVTLATHPVIHYYGEFGSRLIGYEFNVGMPSEIMRAAFLRGAAKQYGRLTEIALSVWGQGGMKSYQAKDAYRGGPDAGPSASLIKREFYLSYIYGSSFTMIEGGYFTDEFQKGKPELSPLGKINLEALECFRKHPERGVTYGPVGLVLDFYHGWMAPLSKGQFVTWGHFPYETGDFQIYNMFRLLFPNYEDHPMAIDQRGALTATPYGDNFEILLNNAPDYVLKMYNTLVLCGQQEVSDDFEKRLKNYAKEGGQVVLFYPQMAGVDPSFLGFKADPATKNGLGSTVLDGRRSFAEPCGYTYLPVTLTTAKTLAYNEDGNPLITVNDYGKGKVICITAEYGMSKKLDYAYPSLSYAEPKYDILNGVKYFLGEYFQKHNLVKIEKEGIQYVTNLTSNRDEMVLTLVNNKRNLWEGEVSIPGTKIIKAEEWLENGAVNPTAAGKLKVSVPAEEIRIYTLKTAQPFWPKTKE